MTTILCDVTQGMMAADSWADDNAMRLLQTKIVHVPEIGIAAWAGRRSDGLVWWEWVQAGMDPKHRPTHLSELNALLLCKHGRLYRFEDRCIAMSMETPVYAIGSGRDFALAAYRCGKSLIEALEIAAEFDLYTGPPFLIYALDDVPAERPVSPHVAGTGRTSVLSQRRAAMKVVDRR